MGEVYLAESQGAANFTKRVAIKRILPHLASNEDFVRKFIDEAHLMVQLHHGNIMPVLELADEEGELYIVMEYLPGRDLKAVIRRLRADGKRIPVDVALWLIAEICAGLDYAHRKVGPDGDPLHVVHRDVSPSNVMLGSGGEVKLVDFGIARARGGMHQSISGTLQGKFVYMSPEQAEGERVDPRSDVFSAGLVLYELLCGIRPFEGESETETLRRVRSAEIIAPSTIRPDLPEALDAILLKALDRDPDGRYETAAAFRIALTHHLARTESNVHAGDLATFLADTFPEGVEPPVGSDAPMSLDDALNLQLGALTPSIDAFGRTRTSSIPKPQRPPTSTGLSVPASGSIVTLAPDATVPPTPQVGRRRFMLLGLLLGISGAVAAVEYWPREGYVKLRTTPAVEAFETTVDGEPYAPGAPLEAGRTYSVCANAGPWGDGCERIKLQTGPNHVEIELVGGVHARLEPVVKPAVEYLVEIDGQQVKVPYVGELFEKRAEPYFVCVEARGFVRHCDGTVHARPGLVAPKFTLVPETKQPPVVDADAGVPDAGPVPVRKPVVRYVRIHSTPVAKIYRGPLSLGPTPSKRIRVESAPMEFRLTAADHEDATLTVPSSHSGGRIHVKLKPKPAGTGYLVVRARPGAAKLYLDGAEIGVGSVNKREVAAGRHVLLAKWTDPGGELHQAERTIDIRPGETAKVTDINLEGAGP